MCADIHDGRKHKTLRSRTGYRSARPVISRLSHSACDARPVHMKVPLPVSRAAKKRRSSVAFLSFPAPLSSLSHDDPRATCSRRGAGHCPQMAVSAATEVFGEGVRENAPQGRTIVAQLSALATVRRSAVAAAGEQAHRCGKARTAGSRKPSLPMSFTILARCVALRPI
jgi:hypothetical protein